MPYKNPIRALECRRYYKRQLKDKCKAYALDYLRKHPCIDCGEKDPVVLDFDHRDESEKRMNVSDIIIESYGFKALLEEIEKCDVRCANCHRRRHAVEFAHGWRN